MAEEQRPLMHSRYVPIPDHLKTTTCVHHGCVPVAHPVTISGTSTDTGDCEARERPGFQTFKEVMDALPLSDIHRDPDDARDAARWRWLVAHLPRDLTDLAELGIWMLTTVMYQGRMDITGAVDCAMGQEGQP